MISRTFSPFCLDGLPALIYVTLLIADRPQRFPTFWQDTSRCCLLESAIWCRCTTQGEYGFWLPPVMSALFLRRTCRHSAKAATMWKGAAVWDVRAGQDARRGRGPIQRLDGGCGPRAADCGAIARVRLAADRHIARATSGNSEVRFATMGIGGANLRLHAGRVAIGPPANSLLHCGISAA